jgi:dipeptidyl aminopeptidase/acylaminoacyl peptidase
MRKYLFRAFIIAILLYLGVIGWLYLNQRSLLYFPDKDIKPVADYNLPDTQDLMIESQNGSKIQMWYHEPKGNMPMVLYLHGNSYTLAQRAPKFKELIDMGYGFAAPAYQGFSKSEGTPSKKAILGDVRAAVHYLQSKGYDTKNVLLVGESLGSGVAVNIATEFQFAGVLLITPYTSISDRAQEIYWYLPIKYLVKDNFVAYDKVDRINAPLLIVHGTRDSVIPHSHSETLIKLANDPKKFIIYEGKGHGNLDNREVFKEMTKYFIDEEKIGLSNKQN